MTSPIAMDDKALDAARRAATTTYLKLKDNGNANVRPLMAAVDSALLAYLAALPLPAAGEGLEPMAAYHLVFDGFPSPNGPRFIELEDDNGRSFRGGEWISRSDGLTELVLPRATPTARAAVLEPRPLDEWGEDDGNVIWWCWRDGAWLSEPPYIGTPLGLGQTVEVTVAAHRVDKLMRAQVGGWPGYHTHWTPHPSFPAALKEKT